MSGGFNHKTAEQQVLLDFLVAVPGVGVPPFVNGFADALDWLSDARERVVLELVAPFFPLRSHDLIIRCIREYRAANTWPSPPDIPSEKFAAMRDLLIAGGMVRRSHPYERLVLPEFAASAANNLLPKPY